jgi:hypothetical protein
MIALILIAVFYLLPALIVYRWHRISYGPKGVYYGMDPNRDDVLEVVVPFYNIANAIISFEDSPYDDPPNRWRTYRKFFLLKPDLEDGTIQ